MTSDLYSTYNSSKSNDTIVFFFHGFPGDNVRNEDLATYVYEAGLSDAAVLNYKGLGKSGGTFSFRSSIIDSQNFVNKILSNKHYRKVLVFGHSWGGFVTLNLLHSNFFDSVMLLSPYTKFPSDEISAKIAIEFITSRKNADEYNQNDLISDLLDVKYNNTTSNQQWTENFNSMLIFQAKDDQVVSELDTENFIQNSNVSSKIKYEKIVNDHSFSDRQKVKQLLSDWIKSNN